MKKIPSVSIKSKISNVKVVVKFDFVYVSVDEAGIEKRKSLTKQEFDYNRSFRLSIPLHINYDGYLYDHVNTINVILVRAINDIVGDAKAKAKEQMIDMFDMAEVTIKDIYADKESEKDEDEKIAEWRIR